MVPSHLSGSIRVAVVADTPDIAGRLVRVLRESTGSFRPVPFSRTAACERIQELRPHLLLLRTAASRSFLTVGFTRFVSRRETALVLLTPSGGAAASQLSNQLQPTLHLIEPLPSQALVAALHLALAREQERRQLSEELRRRQQVLQTRLLVDQAKSVLMARLGLSEEEAHRRLQQESRNRNRRLADTAQRVLQASLRL
jgi:response regulator NasT